MPQLRPATAKLFYRGVGGATSSGEAGGSLYKRQTPIPVLKGEQAGKMSGFESRESSILGWGDSCRGKGGAGSKRQVTKSLLAQARTH